MKRTVLVGTTLAVALACGCRKSVTYTGPDGSKATISRSGGKVDITVFGKGGEKAHISGSDQGMTVVGKEGEKFQIAGGEGSVALPEGFPKDVPIYPGAKVQTSMKSKDAMTATLHTPDDAAKVSGYYKEQMKANGWEIETTMDMPQGTMLAGKKGEEGLQVMVMSDNKATTVTLSVTKAK
jgi:hypothetical protein